MKNLHIKTRTWLFAAGLFALVGLGACNTGTEPGETNVERSGIKDEGSMVGKDVDMASQTGDTTDLERHYDHADHENHKDNTNKVIGDGAYDGKGEGVQRDDVKKN